MEIIYGDVGSGKTRKLIQESHDTGAVIIAANDFRAKHLKDKAEAYNILIKDPISWYQAMNIETDQVTDYLIDDLDEVLESMFRGKIRTVTLTNENKII